MNLKRQLSLVIKSWLYFAKQEIKFSIGFSIIWTAIILLYQLGFKKTELLAFICGYFRGCNLDRKREVKIHKLAKRLLQKGAETEFSFLYDSQEISTLMNVAFLYDDQFGLDMIGLLVDYGADPNGEDFYGLTPMVYAARRSNDDNIKELWVLGANVLDDDKDNLTSRALYYVGYNNTGGRGGNRAKRRTKKLLEKLTILECRERGVYFV